MALPRTSIPEPFCQSEYFPANGKNGQVLKVLMFRPGLNAKTVNNS